MIVPDTTREAQGELLTTGEAAQVLGTSRQHVVDLCRSGRVPYTTVGTHRRIQRSDVAKLAGSDLSREERRSLWLHRAIAGRVAADPATTLAHARHNLEVMTAAHPRGHAAAMLAEWRALLDGPVEAVLDVLCSRDRRAVDLRQNTPFAGVLDDRERSAVLSAFRRKA